MAESGENRELSFLCKKYTCYYQKGKLILPLAFVEEYGNVLPKRIYLEVSCGHAWNGVYDRDSNSIENLEKMMQFYGCKPYDLLLLHYSGDAFFKVEIYNECAIEIPYPVACYERQITVRTRRSSPLDPVNKLDFTNVELDKMKSTFCFNAKRNFYGLHELVVSQGDLKSEYHYQVLTLEACNKLHLSTEIKALTLGFHKHTWKIGLSWKKGYLYFDRKWHDFVKEANVEIGDICVLLKTQQRTKFRVAILPLHLLKNYPKARDVDGVNQGCKWFKVLDKTCLKSGELEMPKLFAMTYGQQIGSNIDLKMSNGKEFEARFNCERNAISGLQRMFRKCSIYERCTIFFSLAGQSKFEVSVFDTSGIDLFKKITGEYFSEESSNDSMQIEVISSDDDDTLNDSGSEPFADANIGMENLTVDNVLMNNEMQVENQEVEQLMDDMPQGNGIQSFSIELKNSHVNQTSHGAYCSTELYEIYKNWANGMTVTFEFEGHVWEVAVLRKDRSCRFAKGWDKFIKENGLERGKTLRFNFHNPSTFQVLL